jgi:ribosomal protein S18 acetylase RimI-like enzyme
MHKINHNYTINLLKNPKNIIAFHCLDHEFNIYNCPSILIYRKIPTKTEIKYYILFACTKFAFRGLGYASKLIDGLVDRIKFEKNDTTKIIKIITNSLETACVFYELYGFQWKRNESINDHPILMQNEKYEEDKEYFIFELIL